MVAGSSQPHLIRARRTPPGFPSLGRPGLPMKNLTVLVLLASASLCAQSEVVVPRIATKFEGNDLQRYPFGRTGFRTQILVQSNYLSASGGLLNGISFRADNDNSIGSTAGMVSNVTIQLSTTSVQPSTMSTTFTSNVTGTPVTVFSGNVALPPYTSTVGGMAPFWPTLPLTQYPYTVQQGNLLIDITAANSGSTTNGYVMDASLPGGATQSFGTAGALSQPPDQVSILTSATGTQGRFSGYVPGNPITYILQSQDRSQTGGFMVGLTRLNPPIDLTSIGSPGSHLYVQPLISVPYTTVPAMIWYRATIPFITPATNALIGLEIVSQAAVLDRIVPLGVVGTAAHALKLGEPTHPLGQLNAADYAAATGSFSYVSGILGGAVVRLSGTFQ